MAPGGLQMGVGRRRARKNVRCPVCRRYSEGSEEACHRMSIVPAAVPHSE
jgi:hypothetical protein